MDIKLEDCTLIRSEEYMGLENPVFIGQTRPDSSGSYYMVFESSGIHYKIKHQL